MREVQGVVHLEKAYCEYRENKAEEALGTLEGLGEGIDARGLELKAQLLYRLERFAEARALYQSLLKETADEYDDLRTVNLQATEVQLGETEPEALTGAEVQPDEESYEQLYNEACRMLSQGNYEGALKRLNQSEKLCRELLAEDELGEEEIEEEVAILRAQAAYALHSLGRSEEAARIYQEILARKPGDVVVGAVSATNLVAIKGGEANLFDTRKKLKAASGPGTEAKLSPAQKRVAAFNNALLQLHSNQWEPCRKAIAALPPGLDAVTLQTALCLRQKDAKKAAEVLEGYKKQVGETEFPVHLRYALAQLYLIEGNIDASIAALETIPGSTTSLGPLSLNVALRNHANKSKEAMDLLGRAMKEVGASAKKEAVVRVMEEKAAMHLRLGQTQPASALLEDLRRAKPRDPAVLASLIQAYAKFNPAKAEEVSESLAELGDEGLVGSEVDAAALEEEGGLTLSARYARKKEEKRTPKPATAAAETKTKKHKKRKVRLPQNFDPAVPPDPERWLPRYERSTTRRRKDKRKGDREIGRGAQGAVSGAAEALDMSNRPAGATIPASPKPGTTGSVPAPGPRQQRPGGQAKGKKKPAKKGGKW